VFKLSYNGHKTVESDTHTQAHELLDNLLTLHDANSPIDVDVGQVRPEGDALRIIISLSAPAPEVSTLQTVKDDLATALVDLGVEPDTGAAKEQIQINNS
jgi:hypothetical protein